MSNLRTSVTLFSVSLLAVLCAAWIYSTRGVFAEQSIECSVSWEYSGKTVDFATNDDITCINRGIVRTTWLRDTPFEFPTTSTTREMLLPAREFVARMYNKDSIFDDEFLENCFLTMQTTIKDVVGDNLLFWQSQGHNEFPGMQCQKMKRIK